VAILNRLGLPPEKKASFEEMTASSGIIPSSREVEALRLDRALAAQVEDLLKARSDVTSASVVVQYHALDGRGRPAVSVIVQRRPGAALREAEIRDIVAHSVVGVSKEDVFVSTSDVPTVHAQTVHGKAKEDSTLVPFLGFWQVPASEYSGLAIFFVVLVVLGASLAGLFGYIVGQFNWIKRESAAPGRPGASSAGRGRRAEANNDENEGGLQ
jgi:type III secretory pathway lipoprotein EscJ